MEPLNILLVEDDKFISRAWTIGLNQAGYGVIATPSLVVAKSLLKERSFAATIVDVNLEDGNGLDLLRWLKAENISIKTLVVTARQDEEAAILALQRSASEFIRKPIGPLELVTRLDRMFRYTNEETISGIHFNDFSINDLTKEIFYSGLPVALSPSEFQIFRLLVKYGGTPVSRDQLLKTLGLSEEASDRTIDSHISRIRRKIEDLSGDAYSIESVWKSGYRLKHTADSR